jgi:hypothetical protein
MHLDCVEARDCVAFSHTLFQSAGYFAKQLIPRLMKIV